MNVNPFELLKNAQRMQEEMGSFQEKLGKIRVTGSSGGGMAEIDMNGRMDVLDVRIAPEAMEDREMLQDLIMAAYNSAMEKVREVITMEVGGIFPGGIPNIPGIL